MSIIVRIEVKEDQVQMMGVGAFFDTDWIRTYEGYMYFGVGGIEEAILKRFAPHR